MDTLSHNEADCRLHPANYDTGWGKLPPSEKMSGLRFRTEKQKNEWIVLLKFKQNGQEKRGTGFYVNFPGVEKHVILTAAHNLVGSDAKESDDLQIYDGKKIMASNEVDIFVPDAYRVNFAAENDWAIILVTKTSMEGRGLGFSLKLGSDNLHDQNLAVTGYRLRTEAGEPCTSTGKCIGSGKDVLEYEVKTEQGLSGSPVILAYQGLEMAVGIHNNGPKSKTNNSGSSGTRLNEPLLEMIFRRLDIIRYNRALRVYNPEQTEEKDLYLQFLPDEEYAWVHWSANGLRTRFDVFPAYENPSNEISRPLYAFRFQSPPECRPARTDRWVLWNVVRQGVSLTDRLQEYCFPQLMALNKNNKGGTFRLVLWDRPQHGTDRIGNLMELRMIAKMLTKDDIAMDEFDTPEISFKFKGTKSDGEFAKLCLE